MKKFHVFRRPTWRGRKWFWHYKDEGNHKIVANGEGYSRQIDAIAAVNFLKASADAPVEIEE